MTSNQQVLDNARTSCEVIYFLNVAALNKAGITTQKFREMLNEHLPDDTSADQVSRQTDILIASLSESFGQGSRLYRWSEKFKAAAADLNLDG